MHILPTPIPQNKVYGYPTPTPEALRIGEIVSFITSACYRLLLRAHRLASERIGPGPWEFLQKLGLALRGATATASPSFLEARIKLKETMAL